MNKNYRLFKSYAFIYFLFIVNVSVIAQSGIYVGGHFRRERTITVPTLKSSGFTYVILFNIQVETNGDLTMDSEKLCSNGVYTFNATQPNYIADVTSLKTGFTSVRRVESCIGGWTSKSYDNIKTLITAQGSGSTSILYKNFQALKIAIPAIDAINNDDESAYDVTTATSFSVMMFDLGFKTTLAPYMNKNFWQSVATNVNKARPGAVDRIDLQMYEGGALNNPKDWNFNIPLSVGMTNFNPTTTITSNMLGWKTNSTATGGFIWVYNDNSYNLQTYAASITTVFGGGEVVNRDKMKPYMTAYTDCNYLGKAVNFEKGSYNIVAISGQEFPDKSLSSIKIVPGFKVQLYKKNNYAGLPITITYNMSCLKDILLDDSISSWIVRANGDISFTGKTMYFKNRKSGMYMSVADESIAQGANIQQKLFSGKEDQKWALANLGDGAYRILNQNSKLAIQIHNSSMDDGANLEQVTYAGYDNQKFIIQQNGTSGYFKLIPYNSTKYITSVDSQINTTLVQGSLSTNTETDWEIISQYSVMKPHVVLYPDCTFGGLGTNFEAGSYTAAAMSLFGLKDNTLSSVKVTPGFSVLLYDGDNFTGTALQLTESNECLLGAGFDNLTTSFAVKPTGSIGKNGVYYLQNKNSNLYMGVSNESVLEGANIEQKDFSGSTSQLWEITDLGDGVYKLINQKSGLALEVTAPTDSVNLEQNNYVNSDNQKFVLIPGTTQDYFKFVAIQSGNIIEVSGASSADGAYIQQSINLNQLSAEWKLIKPSEMGVFENKVQNIIRIYPNPTADYLLIEHGGFNVKSVLITDLQGQKIQLNDQSEDRVDVSTLRSGMYLINIFMEDESIPFISKFIKK